MEDIKPGEHISREKWEQAWGSLDQREPESIATKMLRGDLERIDLMFDILLDMFTFQTAIEDGDIGAEDEPADYSDAPEVYSVEYTREQQLEDIERIWVGLWNEMHLAADGYFSGGPGDFKGNLDDTMYRLRTTYAPRALTFWQNGKISS